MKWLRTRKKQLLMIVTILVLVAFIVGSFLSLGSDNWLGRTTETVIQTFQRPLTAAGNAVRRTFDNVFHAKDLSSENEQLREKIGALEAELRKEKLSEKEREELSELREFLNENGLDGYDIVTTAVTALDRTNWFSTMTIGAGTADGVEKDDIVVSSEGLIGRVVSVGPNWAKVVCAIHDSSNVSFKVLRNLDILGILSGDGEGAMTGYLLDSEALVKKGDTLITSGMGLYPDGIPIGTVTAVSRDEDSLIIYLTAEPCANFSDVQTVTVFKMSKYRD